MEVVNAHNSLRRKVAKGEESGTSDGQALPIAADMKKLVWDDELALIAQAYVVNSTIML